MVSNQLRFRDLKARGVISSWATLGEWIANEGFPPGRLVANTRLWDESEVAAWLQTPPTDRKLVPVGNRRGRPRKAERTAEAEA